MPANMDAMWTTWMAAAAIWVAAAALAATALCAIGGVCGSLARCGRQTAKR